MVNWLQFQHRFSFYFFFFFAITDHWHRRNKEPWLELKPRHCNNILCKTTSRPWVYQMYLVFVFQAALEPSHQQFIYFFFFPAVRSSCISLLEFKDESCFLYIYSKDCIQFRCTCTMTIKTILQESHTTISSMLPTPSPLYYFRWCRSIVLSGLRKKSIRAVCMGIGSGGVQPKLLPRVKVTASSYSPHKDKAHMLSSVCSDTARPSDGLLVNPFCRQQKIWPRTQSPNHVIHHLRGQSSSRVAARCSRRGQRLMRSDHCSVSHEISAAHRLTLEM